MESATDLLLLPVLLTFFGALVYGLTLNSGLAKGRLPGSRWVGVGIVVLALLAGFPDTWKMTDAFTRDATFTLGKKVYFGHYLAGLIPLVSLLACLAFEFSARRRLKRAPSPSPSAPPA